jgi:ATP-dependent RNA helicase DDX21
MASSITASLGTTKPSSLLKTPPSSSFSLYNTFRLNTLLRLRPNHKKTPTVSFVISAIATPNTTPILTPQEAFKRFRFDDEALTVSKDELDISKLRFPSKLVDSLQKRGITTLFPIQVSNIFRFLTSFFHQLIAYFY